MTIPIFVKTMRQLYLPCGGVIHLLKVGDRTIIPNSAEAVKEAWELIQPQSAEHLGRLVDATLEYIGLPICGMGIKGSGCAHYDGHHIPFVEDEARLPPHIKLKSKSEESGAAFVVDSRFDGAKGLLLSIPHQLWSSRPVGGDSIVNILTFEEKTRFSNMGRNYPTLQRQSYP